ncbi:MAG: polymer-forming cytoskeletal protein [Bacteroidota bacterium]
MLEKMKSNGDKDLNIIGPGTTVKGNVDSSGSLLVRGKITGDVHASDNIEIGSGGIIEGTVHGKTVKIAGNVRGTISATDTLCFIGKAVVQGDISALKLIIEEGARFNGKCTMNEQSAMPPRAKE